MAHLITHVINEELPRNGWKKVAFYTIDMDNDQHGEYFLGMDNNPLNSDYIENLLKKQRIFKLSSPIEISESETLYCDNKGNLIIADYDNSEKNPRSLKIEVPEYKSKAVKKIYEQDIKDVAKEISKSISYSYEIA